MDNTIIKGQFEGYKWESDKKAPVVYYGSEKEVEIILDSTVNPFIIEALLFDKVAKTSYNIKYVDGEYIIRRWDDVSAETTDDKYTTKCFYSNFPDHPNTRMKFLQSWVEVKDTECLDGELSVLKPGEMIFVGFLND